MAKKIRLLRYRNIKLVRRNAGDVLEVGKDIDESMAQTLVRISNAEWVEQKAARPKKKSADK